MPNKSTVVANALLLLLDVAPAMPLDNAPCLDRTDAKLLAQRFVGTAPRRVLFSEGTHLHLS